MEAEKKMVTETNTGNALLGIFQAKGLNQLFPVARKLSCLTYVYPTICTQIRGKERGRRRSEREGEERERDGKKEKVRESELREE